jgi:hypothetical protein
LGGREQIVKPAEIDFRAGFIFIRHKRIETITVVSGWGSIKEEFQIKVVTKRVPFQPPSKQGTLELSGCPAAIFILLRRRRK